PLRELQRADRRAGRALAPGAHVGRRPQRPAPRRLRAALRARRAEAGGARRGDRAGEALRQRAVGALRQRAARWSAAQSPLPGEHDVSGWGRAALGALALLAVPGAAMPQAVAYGGSDRVRLELPAGGLVEGYSN